MSSTGARVRSEAPRIGFSRHDWRQARGCLGPDSAVPYSRTDAVPPDGTMSRYARLISRIECDSQLAPIPQRAASPLLNGSVQFTLGGRKGCCALITAVATAEEKS